jgi:hypothetical protein
MDIEKHCKNIINNPRIDGRFVILCEGDILESYSPSSYAKINSTLPDANFYKACTPPYWARNKPPVFYNSGSRSEVIRTYQTILDIHAAEVHEKGSEASNLSPEKVFALVDIDLQSQPLENYEFASIDEAFQGLFTQHQVNVDQLHRHKIWFTGFIHKEAYFLAPELQEFFDHLPELTQHEKCTYQNNVLSLNHIYQEMIKDISHDQDLELNWHRAVARISHCNNLNLRSPKDFQESWQTTWPKIVDNIDEANQLIYALLSIRKVKPYWECIQPAIRNGTNNNEGKSREFRDDISLEIASKIYAHQEGTPYQHFACFFQYLYQLEYGYIDS